MVPKIHFPETDAHALETNCRLMSDRQRRIVVDVLSNRQSSISLHELATAVLERSSEPDIDTASRRHDVVTALHHVHLPKLDDADILKYETETNVVVPTRTAVLSPFLHTLDDGSVSAE